MIIKLDYTESNKLKKHIEEIYTNNNGKKGELKPLIIKRGDIYFTLLSKTPYTIVKFTNPLIDGSISFDKKEYNDHIELLPKASYCIMNENKYSFY